MTTYATAVSVREETALLGWPPGPSGGKWAPRVCLPIALSTTAEPMARGERPRLPQTQHPFNFRERASAVPD